MVCKAYPGAGDFDIKVNIRVYKMHYEPVIEPGSDFELRCKSVYLDNCHFVDFLKKNRRK